MLTKEPVTDRERAEAVRASRHDEAGAAKHLSPVERDMRLAVAVARLAEDMLQAFWQEHGEGCGCDFCQAMYAGNILDDLYGLRTVLSMVGSILQGEIAYGWRDHVGATFAEDLRDLADEADRVAALHDAAPAGQEDEADAPALVGAEGGAR